MCTCCLVCTWMHRYNASLCQCRCDPDTNPASASGTSSTSQQATGGSDPGSSSTSSTSAMCLNVATISMGSSQRRKLLQGSTASPAVPDPLVAQAKLLKACATAGVDCSGLNITTTYVTGGSGNTVDGSDTLQQVAQIRYPPAQTAVLQKLAGATSALSASGFLGLTVTPYPCTASPSGYCSPGMPSSMHWVVGTGAPSHYTGCRSCCQDICATFLRGLSQGLFCKDSSSCLTCLLVSYSLMQCS